MVILYSLLYYITQNYIVFLVLDISCLFYSSLVAFSTVPKLPFLHYASCFLRGCGEGSPCFTPFILSGVSRRASSIAEKPIRRCLVLALRRGGNCSVVISRTIARPTGAKAPDACGRRKLAIYTCRIKSVRLCVSFRAHRLGKNVDAPMQFFLVHFA